MKRILGWLLTAAVVTGVPGVALAQYSLPHFVTIPLASQHHNATFPNGKDSLSFWLETGAKQTASANYDSTVAVDTLTAIQMSDNYGMLRFPNGLLVNTDSTFIGRLTLRADWVAGRILAATTDTIVVFTDVSPDGVTWLSADVSRGKTPLVGTGISSNNEANNVVTRQLWSTENPVSFAGVVSTATLCNCMGAVAIRFRLAMPSTLAKVKIKSATWSYFSTKPLPGPGAR